MDRPVGRPRKDKSVPVEFNEAPIEQGRLPQIKVKVVAVGDYYARAREIYGPDDFWKRAVEMLYSEYDWPNKRIDIIDKKGEQMFVCQL